MTDKNGRGGIFCVTIGFCLLLLSSCVTTGSAPDRTETKPPDTAHVKPALFQSKDYVIYELTGGETPESLAQRFLGDPKKEWVITENNQGVTYEKGQRIVIPLKEQRRGGLTVNGYQKVPILVYHTFAESCKSKLCLTKKVFEEQMAYLKENGYHVILLSDLVGFLELRTAFAREGGRHYHRRRLSIYL